MSQVGEPTGQLSPDPPEPEPEKREPCKRIYLHAFRGDRTTAFVADFNARLLAAKNGQGPGPSITEVLIWSGHVGVSFEAQTPIYGFNPKVGASNSVVDVVEQLKARAVPYPGTVTDDSSVFDAARQRGLAVVTIEYIYPESRYNEIKALCDAERGSSQYQYSFPGGGGDCNCATFPARIGLPVPEATGNMKLYMAAADSAPTPQKKGICDG